LRQRLTAQTERKNKKGKSLRLSFIILTVFWLTAAGPAYGADLIRLESEGKTTIRADRIIANDQDNTILALGEVEIERKGNRMYADQVLLHTDTMLADASGRVRFTTAGEILTGQRMLADMNSGVGKIYEARLFLLPTHFYLSGKEIERTGTDTYWARDAFFTSCDGENPPWSFSSQEMEVEVEGYGTAYNATFDIKGQPVLWSPWFMFPAKNQRQSGLLLPYIGISSRDGLIYSQSYFQTLGQSQDLTLTANIMGERGIDLGLEYRYNLDGESRGVFMLDFMPGDSQAEALWQNGENFENYGTRWWLRGKADHYFSDTTSLRLDLDLMSDRDYLREFDFTDTGYWSTVTSLRDWFRRDMDSQYSLTRANTINFNHRTEDTSFNAALVYYDRLDNDKTTLQRLPYLTYDLLRQEIGETSLLFSMDSTYSYYSRREGSQGHILDLDPQISLPLNFGDYLIIEPSLRWHPRIYALSLEGQEDGIMDDSGLTSDTNFTLDASTYLYNVYDLSDEDSALLIKHAVRPRISYSYQSSMSDHDTLPWLIERYQTNYSRISYGLENSFTSKVDYSPPPAARTEPEESEESEEPEEPEENMEMAGQSSQEIEALKTLLDQTMQADDSIAGTARYNEFMRFNIYHSYYIQDYIEQWTGEKRSLGNIEARWELKPFLDNNISFIADADWEIYRSDLDLLRLLVIAHNTRGDFLGMDYSYNAYNILNPGSRRTNQVRLYTGVNLGAGFSIDFETRYNLESQERFEHLVALNYRESCWGLSLIFHEDDRDHAFFLALDLAGIGKLGGR
jgi:LPS-assembly protein